MKKIGCIGGTSWVSTVDYYRIFNETVMQKLGKTQSAKCIIYSLEFDEITKLFEQNKWEKITQIMIDAFRNLLAR